VKLTESYGSGWVLKIIDNSVANDISAGENSTGKLITG